MKQKGGEEGEGKEGREKEEEEGEVARTLRPVQSHTAQFNIQIRESKHHFFLEHTSLLFSNACGGKKKILGRITSQEGCRKTRDQGERVEVRNNLDSGVRKITDLGWGVGQEFGTTFSIIYQEI